MRYSDRHLYKNAYYREQNPATANIKQISTDDPDIQAFLKCLARTKAGSQTGISARASRTASEEEGEPVRAAAPASAPAAAASAPYNIDTLRNGLARLLVGQDWSVTHSDAGDLFGPLKITYVKYGPNYQGNTGGATITIGATIAVGDENLQTLSDPSALELYDALMQQRTALEAAIKADGPRILNWGKRDNRPNIYDKTVPRWPDIKDWAGKQKPRVAISTILYLFYKLKKGEIPSWRLAITPPDLSEQKDSVFVPGINLKIHRLVFMQEAEPAPKAAPASNTREADYSSLMKELEKQTYQDGVSIAAAYLRGMNTYPMPEDPEDEDLQQSRANRAELASLARSVDAQILSGGVSGGKLLDKISSLLENMLAELLDSNVNPFSARDGGLAMRKQVVQGTKAALGSGAKQAPLFDLANIFFEIPVEGDTYLDRARLAAKDLNTLLEGRGKTYAGQKLANLDLGNSDLTGLPAVLADVAYKLGFASINLFGQGREEGEPYVERVSKVLNALV